LIIPPHTELENEVHFQYLISFKKNFLFYSVLHHQETTIDRAVAAAVSMANNAAMSIVATTAAHQQQQHHLQVCVLSSDDFRMIEVICRSWCIKNARHRTRGKEKKWLIFYSSPNLLLHNQIFYQIITKTLIKKVIQLSPNSYKK
jgi:hypothetical protein